MSRMLLCLIFFTAMSDGDAAAADKKQVTYQLPRDSSAVVISYDEQNGFTPPRQNAAPLLSILADGTVLMPDLYGQARDITGKISQTELQGLLRLAIENNGFFSYDAAKVKEKMLKAESDRQIPRIADAPESVFEIRLADRKHNVRHYALGMAGQFYKDIEELQKLRAIHERLRQLMNETRVGGKAGIRKLVTAANTELQKQHPGTQPFTGKEFRGSYIRRDGKTAATISRNGKTAEGKPDGTFVVAIIEIPGNGVPAVKIRARFKP
ncbi:MAG: hypothetical protein VB858_21440 [Planctomycetaceae bacterium]